eukprot:3621986-Prymnesium_polylepis.1
MGSGSDADAPADVVMPRRGASEGGSGSVVFSNALITDPKRNPNVTLASDVVPWSRPAPR